MDGGDINRIMSWKAALKTYVVHHEARVIFGDPKGESRQEEQYTTHSN